MSVEDLPDKMEQVYFQEFNAEGKRKSIMPIWYPSIRIYKKNADGEVDKFQVNMMTRLRKSAMRDFAGEMSRLYRGGWICC